ncbi:MAG: molybdopterin cofactor-binding domain-containing protein [Rhodospirillales bacterium]
MAVRDAPEQIRFVLNGALVAVAAPPMRRLVDVLRTDLGLTGTKIGCNAGTCGACTVLLDGRAVCACLTPVAQAAERTLVTVEGLAHHPGADGLAPIQRAFRRTGAVQCGMCTPGMLVAATALLDERPHPDPAHIAAGLGGVYCRCTGYRKIIAAVADTANGMLADAPAPVIGAAVGAAVARVDARAKLDGSECFGNDVAPADALVIRIVRAPFVSAQFVIGDLAPLFARYPGLVRVLTADDIPGENAFGIAPAFRDQPVFAVHRIRFAGEAIAAVVGDRATIDAFDPGDFPVYWQSLPEARTIEAATTPDAPLLFEERPSNELIRGIVETGDVDQGFAHAAAVVEGRFETSFVEHAYVEPEAGSARRVGDIIEISVSTQTPYANRLDVARILGLGPDRLRIIATAVGGGFGGKLDLSVQPYLALAAWLTGRPVRLAYTRRESMMVTTKRHPAQMVVRLAADAEGRFSALDFRGDFNTGAYASWGPTVATRVPIHCSGPYAMPAISAHARAIYTNNPPAGAFRGFGVPQAAIATEGLIDELADRLGLDRLEFRIRNALRPGDKTATGQVLDSSVGIVDCLEALKPRWRQARAAARTHNEANADASERHGVGVAAMWYGCGNTSLSNPSTMRVGLSADGRIVFFQGAVDIGQGSNTVLAQILADTLGIGLDRIDLVRADTARTADAGKTSASRQTFVSGQAVVRAGQALQAAVRRLVNGGESASVHINDGSVVIDDGARHHRLDLGELMADADGLVVRAEGSFDPPTSELDGAGQGEPYATYAFGAQVAEVVVDMDLGRVRVTRVTAAHDVGRAINPAAIEGQIEGGIVQGLGMALMEEYIPGRTDSLGDYMVPMIGDVPEVETILIEAAEPLGPFGAKGVGEPALIPTAAAILNAVRDATGIAVRRVPATPARLRALILAQRGANP